MVSAAAPQSTDDPQRYAADVVRASGSSFARPIMFLPRHKRQAMIALYAFCRETDDIVDEIPDPEEARERLAAWRAELDALFDGHPRHPVTRALAAPVAEFHLPKRHFVEILEGFEMDRSGRMVRPDMTTLERYCYCVASCVGLISIEIFGYKDPRVRDFAYQLGQAFQLTNILRDVEEDAARGRIYLPREILERHGLDKTPARDLLGAPAMWAVCRDIGALAREHFAAARAALPAAEVRNMRPALLMRAIYERYLDRMEASDWRLNGSRVRLGRATKAWVLLRALFSTL